MYNLAIKKREWYIGSASMIIAVTKGLFEGRLSIYKWTSFKFLERSCLINPTSQRIKHLQVEQFRICSFSSLQPVFFFSFQYLLRPEGLEVPLVPPARIHQTYLLASRPCPSGSHSQEASPSNNSLPADSRH